MRLKCKSVCVLQIELHFMGLCVRWFPVLHPGCVYRLIARNTEVRHTHSHRFIASHSLTSHYKDVKSIYSDQFWKAEIMWLTCTAVNHSPVFLTSVSLSGCECVKSQGGFGEGRSHTTQQPRPPAAAAVAHSHDRWRAAWRTGTHTIHTYAFTQV